MTLSDRAGRREWLGLTTLLLPCLLVSVDMTVLVYAVPAISRDLEPSGSELLWIMDIYGFLLAGLLITMGALGDRIGRRRLLLIGAACFGLASVGAAYSTSTYQLIAARALLGIAGATLMPSALGLIRTMFTDAEQRRVAMSVWSAGLAGGAMLGPLAGGLILEHFTWGAVFLTNVPVMALLLVIGPRLIPETRGAPGRRFDLLGAVLSLVAVLTVIFGIKRAAQQGFDAIAVGCLIAGLIVAGAFLAHQRLSREPAVPLELFRDRGFSVAMAINTLSLFTMTGFGLLTGQFLQLVLGMAPFTAALWALPAFAATVVGAMVAPALTNRIGRRWPIVFGLLLATAGLLITAQADVQHGLAPLLIGTSIMQMGMGGVLALTADLIVSYAPPERAGVASALSSTGSELGGALGIALLGSLGYAVYRHSVSAAATGSLPAGRTLGEAVDKAQHLPAAAADQLLTVARQAFTDGLTTTAMIAAAITVGTAVLALALNRRSTAGEAAETPSAEAVSQR